MKKLNAVMNSGRHAVGAPIAKSGFAAGSGPKDSGGKIFNPDQKAKSNITSSAAPKVPNTAPAGNPLGTTGSGVVNKKVAGIQKFYGK